MIAVANKGLNAFAFARQFQTIGDANAAKMLGLSEGEYKKLGAEGAANYYLTKLDPRQFGLDLVA